MSTLKQLKREAERSCRFRGHIMNKWVQLAPGNEETTCAICKKGVQVLLHPAPNQINIGGSAVALNCADPD